jgi:hypothetical protein
MISNQELSKMSYSDCEKSSQDILKHVYACSDKDRARDMLRSLLQLAIRMEQLSA